MTAVVDALDGDYLLRVKVSRVDEVEVGDHVVVREHQTAEDGQVVVAKTADGEHTLAHWPVDDGLTVVGLVVGVVRSLL